MFVRGITLNDFANGNGLTQFLDADMAHDTLVNGVLGELELTACDFLANAIDDCHGLTLYLDLPSPIHYFRDVLHCEMPNSAVEIAPHRSKARGGLSTAKSLGIIANVGLCFSNPLHGILIRLSMGIDVKSAGN
jgi:hypothetical protein